MEDINQPRVRQGVYFWVVGKAIVDGSPRKVIVGPEYNESDANRLGFEKFEGDFKVVPLPTMNEARATQMLKGNMLKQDGSTVESSMRKISHIKRGKKKRRYYH